MKLALISAFGVGGATIAGVIIGFLFGKYHTNLTMRFLDLQQESCFQQQFWD